jgi:hypothetical protein
MSIRRYYHQFKETELNTFNGANFKCFVPSKINKPLVDYGEQKIKIISNELAQELLMEPTKLCFNSNFDGWFYKLCPFKIAQQILPYKKKDEMGAEYTEVWTLGMKELNATVDLYTKETNDTDSYNLSKSPYVMVEGRLAKIYNYDLSPLKKYDASLVIDYNIDELKEYTGVIDSYHKDLKSYLDKNPGAQKIPVQRRILKHINKHLILLDSEFPFPKTQNDVNLNLIKLKKTAEIEHAFNLLIYDDFIYCHKCEFLVYYSIGDSIIVRNGRFSESMRSIFKDNIYESRRIINIYDNNLLQVEKLFTKDFIGPQIRNNYIAMNSDNKTIRWKGAKGYIQFAKGNIITGLNTNFLSVSKGDIIFMLDSSRINDNHHNTSTNPKMLAYPYCIVDKVLSNNLILTQHPCPKPNGFKGDFLVGKKFYKYDRELYKPIETIRLEGGIYDFSTFENFSIQKSAQKFYAQNYFFHKGLQIKDNMVIRFKAEKM